jgi:hypothetical protein
MKKGIFFAAVMLLFVSSHANAFVFTDPAAHAQRVVMLARQLQQIRQMTSYITEFNRYKAQFDNYFSTFQSVYRRLSAADWRYYVPSEWVRLRDHLITIWKTFDEQAWQAQIMGLRTTRQYQVNPDYRTYADSLIGLSEEQVDRLKQEEAHLIDLQRQDRAHSETLERYKAQNQALITGPNRPGNEVFLPQLTALTNAILIEMAQIQSETKVVEQRLLTDQKEQRNLITRMKQLETESQQGDSRNQETIKNMLRLP